jgi:hypothetical protein
MRNFLMQLSTAGNRRLLRGRGWWLAVVAMTVLLGGALTACGGGSADVRIKPAPGAGTAAPADGSGTPGPDASSEATPEDEPVELPFAPANRVAGGLLVAEYLAGGLADVEDCLPELVADWELEPVDGVRCAMGDIDADGKDELIYAVSVAGEPAPPGDVWFFDDADADYRFFTSARAMANEVLAGVNIEAMTDLTGDGKPEAVISSQSCDGERCSTEFVIASAHRGFAVEDLAPDDLVATSTEGLTFEDATDDGLTDLLIRNEADDEDPAAGPQRASTLVVAWSGLRFRVDERPDEPEYLIHLVDDADEAYRSGDLEEAETLYLEAADDQVLRDWKAEQGERAGRLELQPYSLFRAALANQRQGDPATAQQLLERAFRDNSNSLLGQAAGIYLQAIQSGNAASTACTAVEAYLQTLSSFYDDTFDYGYANPTHTITTLCR